MNRLGWTALTVATVLSCLSTTALSATLRELAVFEHRENGYWVVDAATGRVVSNPHQADRSGRFRLIDMGSGWISLETTGDRYVGVDEGGLLVARTGTENRGQFLLSTEQTTTEGRLACVWSPVTGKYVTVAPHLPGCPAMATSDEPVWFRFIDGATIAAKYAELAVRQQAQNEAFGCDLIGPQWSFDFAGHESWILGSDITGYHAFAETAGRAEELRLAGVDWPLGPIPIRIYLESLQCLDVTGGLGSDEPYVIMVAAHLGDSVLNIVPCDSPLLGERVASGGALEAEEEILVMPYGQYEGVDDGETVQINGIPCWAAESGFDTVYHPDDIVLVVALMEQDSGFVMGTFHAARWAAFDSLEESKGLCRDVRAERLVRDVRQAVDNLSEGMNPDDLIEAREIPLSSEALLPAWFGSSVQTVRLRGDGGEYVLTLRIEKSGQYVFWELVED